MRVIANILGWTKEIEIPPDAIYKGYVYIGIYPPLENVIANRDKVVRDNITTVLLRQTGPREFSYVP